MSTGSVNTPDARQEYMTAARVALNLDDAATLNEIVRSEIKGALEWSEELDDVAARVAALEAGRGSAG
jgi:hypothetical protein